MRDVVVRYDGVPAVDSASLNVAPGEVVALLGPSGCGKSSLLRAVAGLEPLAGGCVLWDGADMSGVPVYRRGFGLLFQDGLLFAHLSVAQNIAYGLAGQPRAARARRVADLLDVVGLGGFGARGVATLSGGERQRVALARALAPRPRLLLLDEPLSALDRALREKLATDLRRILLDTKTTAIFVTHDHDEAITVADRVAVMSGGRLLQVSHADELWRYPASIDVARFVGYQAFIPLAAVVGLGGQAWSGSPGQMVLAIGPRGLVVADPTVGVRRDMPDAGASASPRTERCEAVPGPPRWREAGNARAHPWSADSRGGGAASVVVGWGRGALVRTGWPAVVVATTMRRGQVDVTVDAKIPADPASDESGPGGGSVRLVAIARPSQIPDLLPGALVHVGLDPEACALLPNA